MGLMNLSFIVSTYHLDEVFDSEATNQAVFDRVMTPIIGHIFEGYNGMFYKI